MADAGLRHYRFTGAVDPAVPGGLRYRSHLHRRNQGDDVRAVYPALLRITAFTTALEAGSAVGIGVIAEGDSQKPGEWLSKLLPGSTGAFALAVSGLFGYTRSTFK